MPDTDGGRYKIEWTREAEGGGESEVFRCFGLTPESLVRRLRRAVQNYGWVRVVGLEIDDNPLHGELMDRLNPGEK